MTCQKFCWKRLKTQQQHKKSHFRRLRRLMGKSYHAIEHFKEMSKEEDKTHKKLEEIPVFDHSYLLKRYEMYLKSSKEISDITSEAYRYLRVRSEFWRQQEPVYNRIKKCRKKPERTVPSTEDLNALQRIADLLQDISGVQQVGDHAKALQLCSTLRKDLKGLSSSLPELKEIQADLSAFEAISHFYMEHYKQARDGFMTQLQLCRSAKLHHHIPRCLENLGRTYIKLKDYRGAKDTLKELLHYDAGRGADKCWLHFELGLCCLELGEYEEAVEQGKVCKKLSEAAFDFRWEVRACVLLGQANLALRRFKEAKKYFENAQYAAFMVGDQKMETLIGKALVEVDKAIEENKRKATEMHYAHLSELRRRSIDINRLNSNEQPDDEEDTDDISDYLQSAKNE